MQAAAAAALKVRPNLLTFGSNTSGQLGRAVAAGLGGSLDGGPAAVELDTDHTGDWAGLGGLDLVAVACGAQHAAAVTADGTLLAWGRDTHGQCGVDACGPGHMVSGASSSSSSSSSSP